MPHPLIDLLDGAARGDFPPADGSTLVLPPPPGRAQAIVAFTGFHVVAADVPEDNVRARLDPDDLAAATRHDFVGWLADHIGRRPDSFDLVAAALGTGRGTTLEQVEDADHPRVARARRYREDVTVLSSGLGTVILGTGLAGRREVSIEVAPEHRGTGVGRHLAIRALDLVAAREPLFAQIAPGNAASVRAFVAAGFQPLGAEILFV